MNNDIIEKVDDYIKSIADSLGVAAEHVYKTLVTQQIIDGWVSIGVGVGLILTSLLFISLVLIGFKRGWNERILTPITGVAVAGSIVIIMMILGAIPSGIKHITNPEYYAIKEILDVFSK